MDEWQRLRYAMADPADVLRANAAKLIEQLAGSPEEPEPLRRTLAAIEQALEDLNDRSRL